MSPDSRKQLELGAVALATALLSSLATMAGNCSVGIVTKGDIVHLATKADLRAITGKAEDGAPPTLRDRVDTLVATVREREKSDAARDLRAAIVLREQTAAVVASWRVQTTHGERKVWSAAREGALGKWDQHALGRPLDEAMERVLLSAGVPR